MTITMTISMAIAMVIDFHVRQLSFQVCWVLNAACFQRALHLRRCSVACSQPIVFTGHTQASRQPLSQHSFPTNVESGCKVHATLAHTSLLALDTPIRKGTNGYPSTQKHKTLTRDHHALFMRFGREKSHANPILSATTFTLSHLPIL